jgi:hypothetical protein
MKTAKSIIVVLFVLLTAQIASAYYRPSTGRWLSRDPIGEPGFQAITQPGFSASLPPGRWVQRDPILETKEANRYAFVHNNSISYADYLGLVGTFSKLNWQPDVTDSTFSHTRGWIVGLSWTPPSSWAKSSCIPCQKVVWIQDWKDSSDPTWHQDWGDSDAGKYGDAWEPGGKSAATLWDNPHQSGPIVWFFTSPYTMRAKSSAKCVAGEDAGKIYKTVEWGYDWSYDNRPTGFGPNAEIGPIAGL